MQHNVKDHLLYEKFLDRPQEREQKIESSPILHGSTVDFILPSSLSLNGVKLEDTNDTDFSGAYDDYKLSMEPPTGEYTICETLKIVGLPFLGAALIVFVYVAAPLGWNAPPMYNNFWVYTYFQH